MHKVILVDDEIYARKGLKGLIRWADLGYEVVGEADNGEDALAMIHTHKPDLVITDIRMPVLDGLGLIRKMEEDGASRPSFIIISGYDDFRYAQQAVRYGVHDFILKPIDQGELTETLGNLHGKLQQEKRAHLGKEQLLLEAKMENVLKGQCSVEDLALLEGMLQVESGEELIYMFVELNDIHPWSGKKQDFTRQEIKQGIIESLHQITEQQRLTYIREHRGRYGVIITEQLLKVFQLDLGRFAADLQRLLTDYFHCCVYLYFGKPVHSLAQIKASYTTANDALPYKFIYDESRIVMYEQVRDQALNYMDVDNLLYQQLLESIEEQNLEQTDRLADRMFTSFQKEHYAPEAVKTAIHHCVSDVVKAIRSMDGDEHELKSLEPIISWQDMNITISELKRLFMVFIHESGQLIAQLRKDYVKGGIQKIRTYIELNYHKNINLKNIAASFYMNPVYLGQLFKKTYGIYFNDFLLQLRVNEAKKLLRQTDMRVYEVAEKVGFSNAEYFVTQFEKSESMTPTEYRNKLLN